MKNKMHSDMPKRIEEVKKIISTLKEDMRFWLQKHKKSMPRYSIILFSDKETLLKKFLLKCTEENTSIVKIRSFVRWYVIPWLIGHYIKRMEEEVRLGYEYLKQEIQADLIMIADIKEKENNILTLTKDDFCELIKHAYEVLREESF